MPGVACRWAKKEGWLNSVTCIGVVSCHKLVSGDLGIRMLSVSIDSQPIPFPAPLAGSCFKSTSGKSHSSCRDVSQQGPQGPPARELVTGDPMACSIMRRPCTRLLGTIIRRQIWQLSPRLEHGRVESINQLAWYHAQIDTSTKWCRQFCSGETRFNQYAVHPKRLAFRFGKPKKQSSPVEYLSFLIRVILDLICWYPIRHTFDHRMQGISPPVFQFLPLISKGV